MNGPVAAMLVLEHFVFLMTVDGAVLFETRVDYTDQKREWPSKIPLSHIRMSTNESNESIKSRVFPAKNSGISFQENPPRCMVATKNKGMACTTATTDLFSLSLFTIEIDDRQP